MLGYLYTVIYCALTTGVYVFVFIESISVNQQYNSYIV